MSDSESVVDELLAVGDDTVMPMPDISSKPHLLISKVRKHYMDYIIKQLSVNFKNNRSLFKKHGHLPSAIWRCAKSMELKAARASMVAQLYRKNILAMIIQVKNDTKNGNLNQTLSEFICTTPKNEKKIQAAFDQPLHFKSDIQNKRRKISKSPNNVQNPTPKVLHSDSTILQNTCDLKLLPSHYDSKPAKPKVIPATITSRQAEDEEELNQVLINMQTLPEEIPLPDQPKPDTDKQINICSPSRMLESQHDDLMIKLENIHRDDEGEDYVEEPLGSLDEIPSKLSINYSFFRHIDCNVSSSTQKQGNVTDSYLNPPKRLSLDERLESLMQMQTIESVPPEKPVVKTERKKKNSNRSKWICEEYFMKIRFYDIFDNIRDFNRKKLIWVKKMLVELFGEENDDNGLISPLEDNPDFINSCKERIAPWVLKLLTSRYKKGRIIGKALFKSVAKHLIKQICQCNKYPSEHQVKSVVLDFLKTHKMIKCEADYIEFTINHL